MANTSGVLATALMDYQKAKVECGKAETICRAVNGFALPKYERERATFYQARKQLEDSRRILGDLLVDLLEQDIIEISVI